MTDRFPFFQKAMLALMGSKDFRYNLLHFFNVLQEHLPIQAISFDHFLERERALFVHYVVTAEGFFDVNKRIALTQQETEHAKNSERNLPLLLFPNFAACEVTPVCKHAQILKKYIPFKDRSYMVGFLRVDERMVGHLACMGHDVNSFSKEHGRLMEMILPACSLAMATILDMQNIAQQNKRMQQQQARMQRGLNMFIQSEMVGAQGGLKHVAEAVLQLSDKDTPVLILGETGTGKELVANAIQKQSLRCAKPFIKVNCGALSDTLLDSELFGHEKGAFTGAMNMRQGRFEQADGGTLFLDEVGELSPQAQVRLLRVLQDGTFERIGGQRPITVDVRIIAATNRSLLDMCRQGKFRDDLFHRLNVFPINMPPLRHRPEDIPLLIQYAAERTARRQGVSVPAVCVDGMEKIMRYPWPGNVRELENMVERAFILFPGGPLDIAQLIPESDVHALPQEGCPHCDSQGKDITGFNRDLLDTYIEEKVRALLSCAPETQDENDLQKIPDFPARIRQALKQCNGKVYGPGGAAELLGLNHNTLRSRMRKWGIKARSEH